MGCLTNVKVAKRTGQVEKSTYGITVDDKVYIVNLEKMRARGGIVRACYSTMIDVDLDGGGTQLIRVKENDRFRVFTDRKKVVDLLNTLLRAKRKEYEMEIQFIDNYLEKLKVYE